MHANNDSLGVRSASVSGSDAEGRPFEVRQSARPTFFIGRATQIFAAFILSSCRKLAPRRGRMTPDVASSTKLNGMYDVYRHLKLTPYRAIIPKDAPFPYERHAQNWRKIATIETLPPEAK